MEVRGRCGAYPFDGGQLCRCPVFQGSFVRQHLRQSRQGDCLMLPGIEGMAGASGSTAAAVSSPIDFAVLSKGSDQAITESTKITFSGVAYGDASMFSNAN